MMRFPRPPRPPGFEARVQAKQREVKAAIRAGDPPDFTDLWGEFKADLARAQYRKCGYCECKTVVTTYGDVEHHAPKSEVWILPDDPDAWGAEVEDLANVHGRVKDVLRPSGGYWWLAYDWDNYLLACSICNSGWKRCYFPVVEDPRTAPPTIASAERPLVLHPFGRRDPAKHLEFHRDGTVTPRRGSRHGLETIKVCGLHRPSLQEARRDIARRTHERIDRLAAASPAATDEILRSIHEDGRITSDHCGMVRAIYAERIGVAWTDLEALVAALDAT
jgi:hypothetical protein